MMTGAGMDASVAEAAARLVDPWRRTVTRAPAPAAGLAAVQMGSWRRRRDGASRLIALEPGARIAWLAEEIARAVFESTIRARIVASGDGTILDFDLPCGHPAARAAHWIRWAHALPTGARDAVARWAFAAAEASPPRVRGDLLIALAPLAGAPVNSQCAEQLRSLATAVVFHDPESQAAWSASMGLGAAIIEGGEPAFAAALDRARAPSAAWRVPATVPLAETPAVAAWKVVQTWAPDERPGAGLWLVPQLPAAERQGAAEALVEGLSSDARLDLHHTTLDSLAPHLGARALSRLLAAFRDGGVDPLRVPRTLSRLAELGGWGEAVSLLGEGGDPARRRARARTALAVLPRLPEEDRAALADRIVRTLDDTPELWRPALECLPGARVDELEAEALGRSGTPAGLLLSALPPARVRPFAERWLAGQAPEAVSAQAWMRVARRAADLTEWQAAKVLWSLLDALSAMVQSEVLDAADEIDLSATLPLLLALAGPAALVECAVSTKAVLDRA